MRRRLTPLARLVAGALTVSLALVWTAPLSAAEPVRATADARTLSASAAAQVAALKPAPRALLTQAPAAGTTSSGDRPFLRSPLGIAAIVVTAVGLGYAVKTAFKDNDPVHSPIR